MPNYPTDTSDNKDLKYANSAQVPKKVKQAPTPPLSASLWIDVNSGSWRVRAYPATDGVRESGSATLNGQSTGSVTAIGTSHRFEWKFMCESFYAQIIPAGTTVTWYLNDDVKRKEVFDAEATSVSRSVSFNRIVIETTGALSSLLQIHGRER